MGAINITAYPSDIMQIEAIKSIMKAFKIKFEIDIEKPYNPEFVAKIQKSKNEFNKGKFTRVKKEDLRKFLGL